MTDSLVFCSRVGECSRQIQICHKNFQESLVSSSTSIRALFLDEVAQIFKFNGEVNIVDHYFLRHVQHDGREVQDAHDAAVHQHIGHFLRGGGGHGEDGHTH